METNKSSTSIAKFQDRDEIFQYAVTGISCVDLQEKKYGYPTIYISLGLQAFLAEGILKIGPTFLPSKMVPHWIYILVCEKQIPSPGEI